MFNLILSFFIFLRFDAAEEDCRYCRLINHSLRKSNVTLMLVKFKGQLRLIYVTTRKIKPGEELLFTYINNVEKIKEIVAKDPSKNWYWD